MNEAGDGAVSRKTLSCRGALGRWGGAVGAQLAASPAGYKGGGIVSGNHETSKSYEAYKTENSPEKEREKGREGLKVRSCFGGAGAARVVSVKRKK